jgi:lactoylglutathione lyase
MVRVRDLDESLDFYCNKFGLVEHSRMDNEEGRFTLVFLSALGDLDKVNAHDGFRDAQKAPLLELTYNWPDENGKGEEYDGGRNFGHLAYRVDDIYATCQKLMDAGVVINRPPRDGLMAFIKSPDGISIELLQKCGPKDPQEPWASMDNTGSW